MRKTLTVSIAAALLTGCSSGWLPWSGSSGDGAARTPPGATAYACEGGKRLLVRFDADAKSAWVIHSAGEFRLDRVAAAAGERFSNGNTTLVVKDGEAALEEGSKLEFSRCKVETDPKR